MHPHPHPHTTPQASLWNFIRYNVVGGGDSALYGVEPPAFYLRNALNNFQLLLPLALALPLAAAAAGASLGRRGRGRPAAAAAAAACCTCWCAWHPCMCGGQPSPPCRTKRSGSCTWCTRWWAGGWWGVCHVTGRSTAQHGAARRSRDGRVFGAVGRQCKAGCIATPPNPHRRRADLSGRRRQLCGAVQPGGRRAGRCPAPPRGRSRRAGRRRALPGWHLPAGAQPVGGASCQLWRPHAHLSPPARGGFSSCVPPPRLNHRPPGRTRSTLATSPCRPCAGGRPWPRHPRMHRGRVVPLPLLFPPAGRAVPPAIHRQRI